MIKKIIDLGIHPFADTFVSKKFKKFKEPTYPLICFIDKRKGYIFNQIKTNEKKRYNLYDYSYTSSNSNYSKSYWEDYSKKISSYLKVGSSTKILEIGSNDGFLLKKLKSFTKYIWGVDASSFMTKMAIKKGIVTFNLVFNKKNSNKLKKKIGQVDLIISNNVLNHSNNPKNFLSGVRNILATNGHFVCEQPYWYDSIKNEKFDQIYHEHISYFTVKSLNYFLNKNSLYIFKIEKTKYHGGSLRIYSTPNKQMSNFSLVNSYIKKEQKFGLYNLMTYKNLMSKIYLKKKKFIQNIKKLKESGYDIIGIGAAAKANTLINFLELDNKTVEFITDTSVFKIGKLTPLSRIPIVNDSEIKKITNKKICAILFSWNIDTILKKKIFKINKNIKFLNFHN